MRALIIGATGATGKDLVHILLQDPQYTQVITFVRRNSGITHLKLTEVLTNFDRIEDVATHIKGDVLFSTLGTTLKTAGSKDKQWHIDYEIPLHFAEIAKRNGVTKMVLLSAYGADANSRVFYSQMKGKLEDSIDALAFSQYSIFKPAMLLRKDTDRPAERIINTILNAVNNIGLFKKFRPMPTQVLAAKMAKAPGTLPAGKHIIELDKIFGF